MRIVFGWNHFKIKSYQPHEVGMNVSEKYDFNFEARQKYFHLFWIPFIGIGKSWAIRKNGGKLYEVPAEMMPALLALENELKAPWYTYLGPLLLLVGGLSFWAYSEIDEYQGRVQSLENHQQYIQTLTNQLNNLDSTDIITLAPGEAGPAQYLKVENIQDKTINFTVIEQQGETYSERMLDVEDHYLANKKSLQKITILKDSLMKAIPMQQEASYLISQFGKDLIGNEKKYIIKEVVRHFRPILRDDRSGMYGPSTISLEFKSFGWPFEIITIKNKVGTIKWDPTMVGELIERPESHYGNTVTLNGTNYERDAPYQFVLTIKDTTGRIFNYLIEGTNLQKTIREL